MLVVRSVQEQDIDSLFDLVQQSEIGLTTLKISRDELASRIEGSLFAFKQSKTKPAGQAYVFVMEDQSVGKLVGTSAVYAKVGGYQPFYTYRIRKSVHQSDELNVHREIDVLHLVEEHDGPSEIGSLFLSPDYWGKGLGRVLSLSRFLFMAGFPERFEEKTIAEMRGFVSSEGVSPLWKALGSHFFQIDYPRAETMTSQSKKFIADLMPRHPIYIPLLPQEAQEVIGQVHPNTEPAKAVLNSEGFEFENDVDIFDGGPTLACATDKIRAVAESQTGTVSEIVESSSELTQGLISNESLDFRCAVGHIRWVQNGDSWEATVDQVTALQLGLKVGSPARSVALKPSQPGG